MEDYRVANQDTSNKVMEKNKHENADVSINGNLEKKEANEKYHLVKHLQKTLKRKKRRNVGNATFFPIYFFKTLWYFPE